VRVLIVEDDRRICAFLERGLAAEGYAAQSVHSAPDAQAAVAAGSRRLSAVLLDLGLPGGDGYELLAWIRRREPALPIIVVTARAEVAERVRGLELGANDYVVKPFAFAELLARLRAVLRSASQPSTTELVVDDLRFDLLTKIASRAGRRIELSPKEWALLEMFMRYPDHVLTRERILSEVWDYDFEPGSNVVDVYVGYLRRKLNRPGLDPLIETVRGAGYRLVPAARHAQGRTGIPVDRGSR